VNCTEFLANLTDYFDARTAATLRTELEQHMAGCSHCYVTLNTTRQTIEIYRNDELFELPDSLRAQLRQAVLTKCAGAKLKRKKVSAKPAVTPQRLMQMAWGFSAPLAVEAGIRNGIFDTLDGATKTAEEIAAATKCSLRGVSMLLDLLAGFELLAKIAPNAYRLTPESETFLVSTKPSFQGGIFRHTGKHLIPQWTTLTEVVRTGKPATRVDQKSEGVAFFEQLVEDIFPMSYPAARVLADALEVACAKGSISVLDLAAGSGVWGIALAQASPQVTVRAVDWPSVLEITQKTANKFGVGDRFTMAPGDLLEADFGNGHQIATLGHILHSEGAERSLALLKKTFQALAPDGTIAIAEFLVNADRTGPVSGLIFAVNMLVNTGNGGTYSFEEIRKWLEQVGFVNVRTLESPGPSPLILADKPVA
jgi:ubiquinone/menaquinone biosynthesis C-methylase UbiE